VKSIRFDDKKIIAMWGLREAISAAGLLSAFGHHLCLYAFCVIARIRSPHACAAVPWQANRFAGSNPVVKNPPLP